MSEHTPTASTTERERWVNDVARYAKTHEDWGNLQPESAVRSILWVVVNDETAYEDLRRAMAADLGDGQGGSDV